MPYDFYIADEELNYTSNVAPMFNATIRDGINTIHGSSGEIALLKLRAIRTAMEDQREALMINNWGNYEGAYKLICDLILLTLKYPNHEWSVCK